MQQHHGHPRTATHLQLVVVPKSLEEDESSSALNGVPRQVHLLQALCFRKLELPVVAAAMVAVMMMVVVTVMAMVAVVMAMVVTVVVFAFLWCCCFGHFRRN